MDYVPNDLLKASSHAVQNICIIGGGPAGLAALKIITETDEYKAGTWKPTVFERRDNVGGVWLPAAPVDNPPLTPLYDSLTTNLPHPVMAYESFSFPPSTPLFPRASVVQKYLEDYVSKFSLSDSIRLNTAVDKVHWDVLERKWKVTTSKNEVRDFDFIIVGNGHYSKPRYPDTPGVTEWLTAGRASHSAWYRQPHNLGDVVLVVGAGPSGQDISAEMRQSAKTVIHSVTGAASEDVGNLRRRGRVVEFRDQGQVVFEDGTIETGIDYCILATGYDMSFPFFSDMERGMPPPIPPLPPKLYNSSDHVFPLAKHIFPIQSVFPGSSVAFLGLLLKVAPFPIHEAQARAAVRVFRHPESLDTTQEAVDIMSRYEELRVVCGNDEAEIAKAWHRFAGREQYDYRDQLNEFADPGVDRKVRPWVEDAYDHKDILRSEWRELERTGEADEWVRGVGERGLVDWIDLMGKILHRVEERQGQRTKL